MVSLSISRSFSALPRDGTPWVHAPHGRYLGHEYCCIVTYHDLGGILQIREVFAEVPRIRVMEVSEPNSSLILSHFLNIIDSFYK